MIPNTIRKEHAIKAAEWIDRNGDDGRPSRRYLVVINGKPYPPKLVISKAYLYAHGSEWPSDAFTGGEETNSYLQGLGFNVVEGASFPLQRRHDSERAAFSKPPEGAPARPGGGVGAGTASTPLERISKMARSMNTSITKVESDIRGEGTDSFLVLHMTDDGSRDVFVAGGRRSDDEVLYVWVKMDFDPPISGYVSQKPDEEYSEFMRGLMRGRTWFDLDVESLGLKGVDLHQRVPVPPGDENLRRVVMAAIKEVLETEDVVRSATKGIPGIPKHSSGAKPGPPSKDSMYA